MKQRFIVLSLLLVCSLVGQAQMRPDAELEKYIRSVIDTHPDLQLRQDMNAWLKSGQVRILSDPSIPMVGSILAHFDNDPQNKFVALVANPDYPTTSELANDKDVLLKKEIQTVHEYTHIKNHFNGKFRMDYGTQHRGTVEQQAKWYWDNEWEASNAHWQFARAHNGLRLLYPTVRRADFANESLWLLQGFYRGMLYAYDPERVKMYKPFWDKLNEQQKAQFSKR
jgi:hypothetical protein